MKSTAGQSQASGPVSAHSPQTLERATVSEGFVRSKRAQPIAALVTKVLDDEPTMAEDWPQYFVDQELFSGPELAVVLGPIYLSFFLYLSFR